MAGRQSHSAQEPGRSSSSAPLFPKKRLNYCCSNSANKTEKLSLSGGNERRHPNHRVDSGSRDDSPGAAHSFSEAYVKEELRGASSVVSGTYRRLHRQCPEIP